MDASRRARSSVAAESCLYSTGLFIFYFSLSFLLLSTIVVLTLLLSYGASTPLAASTETSAQDAHTLPKLGVLQ